MALHINAKCEGKLTFAFKIDMRNLQIFTRALESLKTETLMGSFCPKYKMYELKIYREVMCHDKI